MPLEPVPPTATLDDAHVTVTDGDGVDSFTTNRDSAWLCALAAQIDEDFAADQRRHERACLAVQTALYVLLDESA